MARLRVPARPRVSVNFAITWDGRISTRHHTPANFTSPADKHRLLELRAPADAVLVSARTAAADKMTMGLPDEALRAARLARGQAEYPLRVLISNRGQIDPDLALFSKDTAPIHIFSTEQMPAEFRAQLASRTTLHLTPGQEVDLPAMLHLLRREHGVKRLHCEGGGTLFRSLLAQGLVDDIYLTAAARIFGGAEAPTLTGSLGDFLPASTPCRLIKAQPHGTECFLHYRVARSAR